jgi:hypothetical protein
MPQPSDYYTLEQPYERVGPYEASRPYFQQAASAAMPSLESLDKASARLRGRIDTARRAGETELRDQYGQRGQTYSGGLDQALERNRSEYASQYGAGLTDLEREYLDKQQQGAQILGQLGQGVATAGQQQGELNLEEQLGKGKLFQGFGELDLERRRALADFLMNTYLSFGSVEGQDSPDLVRFRQGLLSALNLYQEPLPEEVYPGDLF